MNQHELYEFGGSAKRRHTSDKAYKNSTNSWRMEITSKESSTYTSFVVEKGWLADELARWEGLKVECGDESRAGQHSHVCLPSEVAIVRSRLKLR